MVHPEEEPVVPDYSGEPSVGSPASQGCRADGRPDLQVGNVVKACAVCIFSFLGPHFSLTFALMIVKYLFNVSLFLKIF